MEAAGGSERGGDEAFAPPRGSGGGAKRVSGVDLSEEFLPLPTVTSKLWEHQRRSVDCVLAGVRVGKLGFADASAVGAGKTLTALATVVEVPNRHKSHREYDQTCHRVLLQGSPQGSSSVASRVASSVTAGGAAPRGERSVAPRLSRDAPAGIAVGHS